jgi:hypothetical protein
VASKRRNQQPLPRAEASYTVDPLSDLVSATELRVWRGNPTTKKVMRYLSRWREQEVEQLAEGGSTETTVDATAMRTVEFVSKAQMLKDILTLEARDIAEFYHLAEPQEGEKK